MPIPQPRTIRVNPLDLQKNIAIGINLPFNAPGVFKSTYTTKDQTKANLINLLLTDTGERVLNPAFGCDLRRYLFEGITERNTNDLIASLQDSIATYIPEIIVTNITINPNTDYNEITLNVNYIMRVSQAPDEVTIQLT